MKQNIAAENKANNLYANALYALDEARDIFKKRDNPSTLTIDKALSKSFKLYEDICEERQEGRYVLSMPTGTGKTTSIIAWCKTIYDKELDYSVCIASSQIKELFTIMKELIRAGVDEDQIGVLYNDKDPKYKEYKKTSKSVESPENYRFLLISHQRLQMDKQKYNYKDYKGVHRNITFWDEAFIKTEAACFRIEDIRKEIGGIINVCDGYDFLNLLEIGMIKSFLSQLDRKLKEHSSSNSSHILQIEDEFVENNFVQLNQIINSCKNKNKFDNEDVYKFLKGVISQEALFPFGKTVMSYRDVIDDDVKNIVVLDASYPISPFYELDTELQHVSFDPIRSYKNLKITHSKINSGRSTIDKIFSNLESKINLFNSLEAKCRSIPNEEALLLFIFKTKWGKDYRAEITQELMSRGIDLEEKISWQGERRHKYNFLTWGHEKGTNDYIHCQHFINIGLLDIGSDNLIAQAMAQTGISYFSAPSIPVGSELTDRDYAQRLYQAISRTAIRLPNNNLKCTATILTYATGCLQYLEEVFNSAEIDIDLPILNVEPTNTNKWLSMLVNILEELDPATDEITINDLNKRASILLDSKVSRSSDVKKEAARRLREKLDLEPFGKWTYEERSFYKTLFLFSF